MASQAGGEVSQACRYLRTAPRRTPSLAHAYRMPLQGAQVSSPLMKARRRRTDPAQASRSCTDACEPPTKSLCRCLRQCGMGCPPCSPQVPPLLTETAMTSRRVSLMT